MRALIAIALPLFPALARAHDAEAGVAGIDLPGIIAALALAAAGLLYIRAWRRGAALRPIHAAAFASGWLALAVALLPSFAAVPVSFPWHMAQHELLMVLAPPLLILGRPFAALAATLPPAALRAAAWPLRVPPLAAWGIHAAALWLWHLPRLFDAAVAWDGVHALQHASFFASALLFWWAVLRRLGTGAAALYILTTAIHSGALAALLTFAPAPFYRDTALIEQQLGGLIMWVPAGYALLAAGLVAVNRLLETHA